MRVALLGASGFVGSEVKRALERRGATVVAVESPRLTTSARDLATLTTELESPDVTARSGEFAVTFDGCDAVVNAAGVAVATGGGDALFGANALLPAVVARAVPAGARFVHISSAAVQGRRARLDESTELEPFSPYSASKALGERLTAQERPGAVVYRPTSVQGAGRPVTQSLVRVLSSPAASVAGRGEDPTPQVLVGNVADAVAFLALTTEEPPRVVLHPWEGLTTSELVSVVGGREPFHVPRIVAKMLVTLGHLVGRWSGAVAGVVRRVEMLWFGQLQGTSWLDNRWTPVHGPEKWKELS